MSKHTAGLVFKVPAEYKEGRPLLLQEENNFWSVELEEPFLKQFKITPMTKITVIIELETPDAES